MSRRISHIPDDVIQTLCDHDWPGNIRELQNAIERAVIMSPGPELQLPDVGFECIAPHCAASRSRTLREAEREHIVKALNDAGGIVGGRHGAASRLGLPRTSLIYRMRKLGISQVKELPSAIPQPSGMGCFVRVAGA
jgi:formate hydrogenlyase transcriptional activator